MLTTNATFDSYHDAAHKTPVYLIHFDGESTDYSNQAVGNPSNTVKQYLISIKGGQQKVYPDQGRASISGITVTLLDYNNEITSLIAGDSYNMHRKKTTIKAGYLGMDEADFITIAVGWITGIRLTSDGLAYEFEVTDPAKWMQRKIFRNASDTNVVHISGNPLTILLRVLTSTGNGTNGSYDVYAEENGLGLDTSYIDISGIEAIRDTWFADYWFSFYITERIQAKDWIEKQILKVLNCYPLTTGEGLYTIKPLKPPMVSDVSGTQTFTEDNIVGLPRLDLGFSELINEVEFKYDWDYSNDEFDTEDFYADTTSINNRGPGKSALTIEAKGVTTGKNGEYIGEVRKQRIFQRYADPPPLKLNVKTHFTRWLTEAGDVVKFTHSKLPNLETGSRGLTAELMEVINRSINWQAGSCSFELLQTGFQKAKYGVISPSAYIVSGISGTQFTLAAADAALFNEGEEIVIRYENGRAFSTHVTITDISGTTMTVENMAGTPDSSMFIEYETYDDVTSDQQDYGYLSDENDYLGTANDAAHLISA